MPYSCSPATTTINNFTSSILFFELPHYPDYFFNWRWQTSGTDSLRKHTSDSTYSNVPCDHRYPNNYYHFICLEYHQSSGDFSRTNDSWLNNDISELVIESWLTLQITRTLTLRSSSRVIRKL